MKKQKIEQVSFSNFLQAYIWKKINIIYVFGTDSQLVKMFKKQKYKYQNTHVLYRSSRKIDKGNISSSHSKNVANTNHEKYGILQ